MGLSHAGLSHAARLARFGEIATSLALLSDVRLGALLDDAQPLSTGIGGTAALLDVDGTPVFVKRVPLTDLERLPANVMSTANLFGLPMFYHYGVGSAGVGVWRELAAHAMTTNWVLGGRSEGFPLMYHWRVLDERPARTPTADELASIERSVEYWHGSAAVRARLTAIATASARLVLCCEYVPYDLRQWLTAQVTVGAVESACAMVESALMRDVSFMNANGLVHFDAHFGNIRTNGDRLYITDFGLATSPRFDLSADELAFLERNSGHDGCHTIMELVNRLVTD
ncbi:MAG TPA: hypothetical protein VH352_23020, partial [Pseudonocardiaceae bacterium]|nr:hypothetical protein [Pseudonocardiaceae bacterium]